MLKRFAVLIAVALVAVVAFAQQPYRESNESTANYAGAAVLVEHDTNVLAPNCRAVFVTADGDLVADMAREGTNITFPVKANNVYPFRIKRFKVASTATGICLY